MDALEGPPDTAASDVGAVSAQHPSKEHTAAVVVVSGIWIFLLMMLSYFCYAGVVLGGTVLFASIFSDHSVSEAFFAVGVIIAFLALDALFRYLRRRISRGWGRGRRH